MQHTFYKQVIAAVVILAALSISACSGAEPPAAGPNEALQAQSVPVDNTPTATPLPPTSTPAPTATAAALQTEIIEEPVSAVASPTATAAQAAESNNMQLPENLPPGSEVPVQAAIDDLAQTQSLPPAEITVISVEPMDWPDASLGCPQEGFMYAQVITPGFLVMLQAQGNSFEYHTDQNDHVVLCQP